MTVEQKERLAVLASQVARGKLSAGSTEAGEYVRLRRIEAGESVEEEVEVVVPVAGLSTKKEQAAFYGKSERTMGYWRLKGAPLGRPAEMVRWFTKTFPGKVPPQGISRGLERLRGETGAGVPDEAPGGRVGERKEAAAVEVGVKSTFERMLAEEADLYRRIKTHEANGELAEADGLRPMWQRLSEALGSEDVRQLKRGLQRGDLVPLAEVQREYASLLMHLPAVLRAEIKGFRLSLDPVPLAHVWDPQVDRLLDRLFGGLPEKLVMHAAAA